MPVTPDFNERLKAIAYRNRKKTHDGGEWWTDHQRQELVQLWLTLGELKAAAVKLGIPEGTARRWKREPWWDELVHELRGTENLQLDQKLTKIVSKSLDAVLDRVENGDFIYDQKSGEIRRKPAALRDLHRVAVDSVAKRETLRRDEPIEQSKTTVEEHLKMLAREMAKWNSKQEKTIDLVEVEDALYEERQTGLQEGTSVGASEETEPGEGQGGAELSPEDDDGRGEGVQG